MNERRSALAAFAVAWLLRASVGLVFDPDPTWDGVIYERAARLLADGEGFTQRMFGPGWWPSRTAFFPPGWPGLLAVVRWTGAPRWADLSLQSTLGALLVPLAWLSASRLSADQGDRARRCAGSAAAWCVALWPSGALVCAGWMTEPLFSLLLLAALVCLIAERRPRASRLVLSAFLFGLAGLVRPTGLAIAPLALALGVWMWRRAEPPATPASAPGPARAVAPRSGAASGVLVAGVALCLFAPLLPWMARNHAQWGAPVVTTSTATNFYVGTLSAKFSRIPAHLDCERRGPPEVERDRCRGRRALARVAADPLGWLALAPLKLIHTFGYESSPALQLSAASPRLARLGERAMHPAVALATVFYWLVVIAAFVELSSRRRADPRRWVLVLPGVAIALVHVVFFGGDRYHLPAVPPLIVLAAPTLAAAWRALRSPATAPPEAPAGGAPRSASAGSEVR